MRLRLRDAGTVRTGDGSYTGARAARTVEGDDRSIEGRKATRYPITLTIVLKRDDQAGFERYLKELYDPHSPNFRRFLTQSQIVKRFGPSKASYDRVLRYLRANGFEVVEGSTNHLTLAARGTRGAAERAFGVRIADYRIGERVFYANDEDPAIPAPFGPLDPKRRRTLEPCAAAQH